MIMDSSHCMMFWNLLVTICLAYADVIREDGYHDYEGQFTVEYKGRMLRVLMFLRNVQQELCALRCVQHLRCRTYNYHHRKKDCELTDEDYDEMNVDTISLAWYNYGTPKKVDGGWSSWRNFTDCTKTCGSGTIEQWRDCDSPEPEHGGDDCNGRMRRRVKCNTHGCPVVNVALDKSAAQSSTYDDNSGPSKAVDGQLDNRAATKLDTNPWWEVDMGEVRVITYLQLFAVVHPINNNDLLIETRKYQVESWILCKDLGDIIEWNTTFTCIEQLTKAQFLRIRSTKRCHLNIHEVEIFGH